MEDISKEIDRQLEAARLKEARASGVNPQHLAAELARIQFRPDYSTDLGITRVQVGDFEHQVHQTRNFPTIFSAANKFVRGMKPANPVEAAIFETAYTAQFRRIFGLLKKDLPALYLRMAEVANNIEEQRQILGDQELDPEEKAIRAASDEEKAEWVYISSFAYNAAADIARSIDENYNLEQLYLGPAR